MLSNNIFKSASISPGEEKEVNFTLQKQGVIDGKVRIYGKVTDLFTGEPIEGANVAVYKFDFPYIPKFKKLFGRLYLVEATKPGYMRSLRWIRIKGGEEKKIDFKLMEAHIKVPSSLRSPRLTKVAECLTDEQGNYELEFDASSIRPKEEKVYAIIYGRVENMNDNPVEGAMVTLRGRLYDVRVIHDPDDLDYLYPPSPPPIIVAKDVTDKDGRYKLKVYIPIPLFPIPLGYYMPPSSIEVTLYVTKPGYRLFQKKIRLRYGEEKEVNVKLSHL